MYDGFEDHNTLVRIRLEVLEEKEEEDLTYQAGLFFLDLLENREARLRADALHGFLGRFPTLRIRESETPQLGNKNLRDHQLCVIHAINHWCKDREGNDIAESVRMDIIADHDDLKLENQGNTIFRRLTDPNITVNQKVAAVTEKHRDFFGRKALDVQTKAPQADMLSATTSSFEGFFVQATGLNPGQHTDPERGRDPVSSHLQR
ncbi:MAG: hypothetical protein ALECFALPRED_010819 [Alectoria fallacina]|uniref:Uncharacterized protein n=1 Tax=Alectoria fallacina TaxID=1903189 RepID=A0A8H3F9I4_9LECA|nr:MAG: hypothetical protein ALECFALPRED_010819 [Alectoria fallacina]